METLGLKALVPKCEIISLCLSVLLSHSYSVCSKFKVKNKQISHCRRVCQISNEVLCGHNHIISI